MPGVHGGRPQTTFTDSRIKADDTAGSGPGSVERGGAIEVFGTAADAQAHADCTGDARTEGATSTSVR